MTKKQHNHATDDDFDNQILYNESEKSSALSQGQCGVCKRLGFPLFLVRQAIIPKNYRNIQWSNGMNELTYTQKEPFHVHEYAYRTLRTGYLYILVQEITGEYRYLAYEITPSGVFRHKSIDDVLEHNIREIPKSCTAKNDHIPGVFINIDRTRYSSIAYIGYSRRAWSKPTLDHYRLAADRGDKTLLNRFTSINLGEQGSPSPSSDELSSLFNGKTQCFPMSDFDPGVLNRMLPGSSSGGFLATRKLMEVELNHQDVIYSDPDKTLAEQLASKQFCSDGFVSAHQFNSFKGHPLQNILLKDHGKNLVGALFSHGKSLTDKIKTPVSVVVIEDPFAIAEELCLQRQLYIDPIMTLTEKSGNEFSESIADVFKERLNGQNDLDKFDVLFKQAINEYKRSYPKESKNIYTDEDDTSNVTQTNEKTVPNLPKITLFDDLYKELPSLYLQPYVANKEYYSEKSLHLRKIMEMIDNYQIHLKQYFNNSEEFKYHFAYRYEYSGSGHIIDQATLYSNSDIYQEVPISDEDSALMAEQVQEKVGKYTSPYRYYSARVFKSKTVISSQAKKAYQDELNKVKNHVKSEEIKKFTIENNQYFSNIAKTIAQYSTDYFQYLTQLFGKKTSSKQDSERVLFWLIECDQNCSNNHLGYLQDFIKMVNFNTIGNIPLLETSSIWNTLLNNSESLYYRLFNTEKENSFWRLMIDARLNQDGKNTIKDGDKTIENAITAVKFDHKKELDPMFCENKGKKIIDLYQIIIQKAISGASQLDLLNKQEKYKFYSPLMNEYDATLMNKDYFKTHLCQAMMVFNKTYARLIKVEVPENETDNFFNYWSSKYGMFLEKDDKETMASLAQIAPYQKVGNGSYAAAEKSSSQWTFEILDLRKTVSDELGNKTKFTIGKDKSVTEKYTSEWRIRASKNNMSELGRSAFLNGINLYLTIDGLNNDLAELAAAEDEQYGQLYKDRLVSGIQKTQATLAAQSIIAINSGVKLLLAGSKQIAFLNWGKNGVKIVNSIIKGTSTTSAPLLLIANGALGIISIIESIQSFNEGSRLIEEGEVLHGWAMRIGASFQCVIGIILLLQTFKFISLAGPWAAGLALGAFAIMFFMYIFRDESQDWVPIEVWANRTLLGKHSHSKKWPTYPPSLLGTGIATNDYLAAVQGLNCNIEFGQKNESTYFDQIEAQKNVLKELDQKFKVYLENRKKVTAGSAQEENLKADWYSYVDTHLKIDVSTCKYMTDQQIQSFGGGQYNNASADSREKAVDYALHNELSILKTAYSFNAQYKMQGLYIQMTLPKYDTKISLLEAYLHISKGNETMILTITNGVRYPIIKSVTDTITSVTLRGEHKAPIRNIKIDNTEGVTKNEYYDSIKRPKMRLETGLPILVHNDNTQQQEPILEETDSFKITYKVAEIFGDHDIYLKVNYWQEGKSKVIQTADNDTQTITLAPLVQVYHYQKD